MNRAKAILGICLIFLLGFVAGGMAAAKFMERRVRAVIEGGPEAITALVVRRLDRSLDLSSEQEKAVREVVDDARDRIRRIRLQTSPAINRILLDAQTSIRAVLNADQAKEFDQLAERARAKWQLPLDTRDSGEN